MNCTLISDRECLKVVDTFRNRDAVLTKAVFYRAVTIASLEPPVSFFPKIDMSDEVDEFLPVRDLDGIPPARYPVRYRNADYLQLYESKLIWHYDHRFGSFDDCSPIEHETGNNRNPVAHEKTKSDYFSLPRYLVPKDLVDNRYQATGKKHGYLLAVRRLTNATNERTAVFSVLPYVGCGNSLFVFHLNEKQQLLMLLASGNSILFDYIVRNKLGGTNFLQFIIEQLAVPPSNEYLHTCAWHCAQGVMDWLVLRVLELTYTSWDLEPFAQDCGWPGPPFRWDEERRFLLRCELDAAFFQLYLPTEKNGDWRQAEGENDEQLARLKASFPTPRDAVAYIMDTFPIVKRKDEGKYGTYRTKDTILEIYGAMSEAMRTGQPFQTRLNPPPADPRCCHPAGERCVP